MSSWYTLGQNNQVPTAAGTTASGGFFGGIGNWLSDNSANIGTAIGQGASIYGALNNAQETKQMGGAIQDYLSGLGADLQGDSTFQGYGVSTGLGTGSSLYNENGMLVTDLGMNQQAQNQMNNMQNNYALNLQNAANAYNSAGNISGGQTATDFNAMSGALQGAANGITPVQGPAGSLFASQMQASQGIGPNQGWGGQQAQQQLRASQGMAPGQGAFGGQAQVAASQALANPSQRQAEIYSQMMNMQRPELDRMAAQSNAQEYAMGRGGVMGSQYGGTAEDAAMARARAQASNQATLNAMQQADSERSTFGQMASQFGQLGNQNYANQSNQQSNLASSAAQMGQLGNQNFSNMTNLKSNLASSAAQMGQIGNQNYSNMGNYASQLNNAAGTFGQLGNQADGIANDRMGMLNTLGGQLAQLGQQDYQNSFMPMAQQIEAMKLGYSNADMAQTGQLTGNDYLAQLLIGGTNANINAQHSANELTGSLYNALLSNTGGSQGSDGSSGSGLMGLIGSGLDSGIDWLKKTF